MQETKKNTVKTSLNFMPDIRMPKSRCPRFPRWQQANPSSSFHKLKKSYPLVQIADKDPVESINMRNLGLAYSFPELYQPTVLGNP
jgi:hypothetical protein